MYLGLLIDKKEPDPASGYARMEGDPTQTVFFPVSLGYGVITHIARFDNAEGGEPVETIALPVPVDCHAGVVPFVHEGRLFRGVEVTAQGKIFSANKCQL